MSATEAPLAGGSPTPPNSSSQASASSPTLRVRKRSGETVSFDGERIRTAIAKAFCADLQVETPALLPPDVAGRVARAADAVLAWCELRPDNLTVESIQDEVERVLMVNGEHRIARSYVLYRERRAQRRRESTLHCVKADGTRVEIDAVELRSRILEACADLGDTVLAEPVAEQTLKSLFNDMPEKDVIQAAVMAARAKVEIEPCYTYVAARLLLGQIYEEATGARIKLADAGPLYRSYFPQYLELAVANELLDPKLQTSFDLVRLCAALKPERDLQFAFLGLQTLYDRYFTCLDGRRIELPQIFWMRVSMGLSLNEADPTARAIQFYDLLSSFDYTSATPTLFNSGTLHPQLSSCYLSSVQDDLDQIFKAYRDNALLSKWAGGLGNDWTNVRALGAKIKGTGGKSQGVVPFLKIANDGAVAVNQGGKRKGAICAYLETWHLDIEEFLELRKNTGDERRRTHDMNTANWIPDLFMKRVAQNGQWTLFSPDQVPDLHDSFGKTFEQKYTAYERLVDEGKIKLFKRVQAVDLWRKMLSMLFETGHPWITFKDPSNVRSPQDHVGVVHNSNLCTEILLNNSADETAVCNLGSVNLAAHVKIARGRDLWGNETEDRTARLDLEKLEKTVRTAVRMLDNVIDLNFYPTVEARNANMRHRPVGLGIMGFQDALYKLGISYASDAGVRFADESMEAISFFAILASTELARERGTYPTYQGSKWSKGLLPLDTLDLLEQERGMRVDIDRSSTMNWGRVRDAVKAHGMRNSNVMAIAPTATISNIVGVSQSIEPSYKNLYVKSNLSGEFTQVNNFLIEDLRALALWDADLLDELKYQDGGVQEIDRIPPHLKERYRTAFEIDAHWVIEAAARRQKWIDMGQSLNLYMSQPSGKKLNEMYFLAWNKGLKTTYYLRTLAATQVEKSTLDVNKYGIQPKWMKSKSASSNVVLNRAPETPIAGTPAASAPGAAAPVAAPDAEGIAPLPSALCTQDETPLSGGVPAPKACSLDNPECEACQ